MYVCVHIFDTHIYQRHPHNNCSGSQSAPGASEFANLNLECCSWARDSVGAARGTWSGSLLGIGSGEGQSRAAAAGRLLAGLDLLGGGAGHAPEAVAEVAAPRTRRRPRLLALFQASPSSPPLYKRRDRGAGASLRQLLAG